MHANVAVSVEVSSEGLFTHSQASCFGEASASGRVSFAHQLPPGYLRAPERGGVVRRAWSQRWICFEVP